MHPLWWCQKLCPCLTSSEDWLSILFPQKKKALWGGSFAHVGRIKLPARLTVITPTEVGKGCTLGIYVCMYYVWCYAKWWKSLDIFRAVSIFWSHMNIKTLRLWEEWIWKRKDWIRKRMQSGSGKKAPPVDSISCYKSPVHLKESIALVQVHLFLCDAL